MHGDYNRSERRACKYKSDPPRYGRRAAGSGLLAVILFRILPVIAIVLVIYAICKACQFVWSLPSEEVREAFRWIAAYIGAACYIGGAFYLIQLFK